jgi:Raf kinase inhibitor-like YbhB/YbcL family protein
MKLASSAFADGRSLPAAYTCDATGRSPPLAWSDPPANTRSFALVVEDPDAPGGIFRHWGAYDIPATTHELSAGEAQDGACGFKQTRNDFGNPGFGPPCPPTGGRPHHHRFRLMALDVARLGSPSDVNDLLNAAKGHVLGTAELIALYGGS